MLENALINAVYTLPEYGLTFTKTQVYFQDGFAVVHGLASHLDGTPVRKDFGWFCIGVIDVYNPLLDQPLCDFWKKENIPIQVKQAVEEIAYQNRRIVSASSVWGKLQAYAISKGIYPNNQPVNLKGIPTC